MTSSLILRVALLCLAVSVCQAEKRTQEDYERCIGDWDTYGCNTSDAQKKDPARAEVCSACRQMYDQPGLEGCCLCDDPVYASCEIAVHG